MNRREFLAGLAALPAVGLFDLAKVEGAVSKPVPVIAPERPKLVAHIRAMFHTYDAADYGTGKKFYADASFQDVLWPLVLKMSQKQVERDNRLLTDVVMYHNINIRFHVVKQYAVKLTLKNFTHSDAYWFLADTAPYFLSSQASGGMPRSVCVVKHGPRYYDYTWSGGNGYNSNFLSGESIRD